MTSDGSVARCERLGKVMLRVDAKQGSPKDGNTPLELFQVDIYPLKIHLTESLYKVMWHYFFPEEEQDSQRRQEVWKVSTTAAARRVKKGTSVHDASPSSSHSTKDAETSKSSTSSSSANQSSVHADLPNFMFMGKIALLVPLGKAPKSQHVKAKSGSGSIPELRRTSSFDRTWEETVAEGCMQMHSSNVSSPKAGPNAGLEQQDENTKNKLKETKQVELFLTYEGSRFAGKKFKDKAQPTTAVGRESHDSDGGSAEKTDQLPMAWPKRTTDGR
ncbi:protein SABRE [Sesamum angolense]|uniref:Protein SABRE n=1 Tax=Sesamum angolense TaxID=2727404 RepID=A0AAE1W6G7_9LAMI|nr:protein SABRE [Sesamum angolense]